MDKVKKNERKKPDSLRRETANMSSNRPTQPYPKPNLNFLGRTHTSLISGDIVRKVVPGFS